MEINKKRKLEDNIIYYGEIKCENSKCNNKAYWKCDKNYLCGIHSRNIKRVSLPKMENKIKSDLNDIKLNAIINVIKEATEKNKKENKKGNVKLLRMRMMKSPEQTSGYLLVFPNYKHQNRKDGFGCSSLSPMLLGPVKHGQPDLPDALNIENFHQGSKCFKEEVDTDNQPNQIYYDNRLKWYNDPVAHRHKYKGDDKKNKNIPLYFIWKNKIGEEKHLSYIESRQFYCNFYERLASEKEDFKKLVNMIEEGMNIEICGYDAHDIDNVESAYLDPTKPFGHELVLYTMLTCKIDQYPWRKYKTFEF
jgi:hypothetical protein